MGVVFVTFYQMQYAMRSMHLGERRHIDTLHDVWLKGAPSPDSIIRNPVGYDPRVSQVGNVEKRLLLPRQWAAWVSEVADKRGIACTPEQAQVMIENVRTLWKGINDEPGA